MTKLRPQVAVWEREVPRGAGITGLWRAAAAPAGNGASQVFTFRQNGNSLTGTIEGGGRGGDTPIAIEAGKVDGASVSFKAASAVYTGTLQEDAIELQRSGGDDGRLRGATVEPAGARTAIGPPPDGSDPSRPSFVGLPEGGRGPQAPAPMILHRTKR